MYGEGGSVGKQAVMPFFKYIIFFQRSTALLEPAPPHCRGW